MNAQLSYIVSRLWKSGSWNTKPHAAQELPLRNTSRPTLKDVTMEVWVQCMCEDDYTGIGNDTSVWIDLVSEYQLLRGDTIDAVEVLRLSKEIRRTQDHLYLVGLCISALENRWSDSIADSLRKLGYTFNPASHNPNDYRNNLQACVNKSKTKYIYLQQLIKQLEEAQPNAKKPTREYYEETLMNIEQFQKVAYNFDTLSVYKFVLMEKRLTKAVIKANNGRSNNR